MAAPVYSEDLTDITLAELTTNWSALGGGASGLGIGVDFAMQGTNCVDKQITASEKGQVYNNGATITPGANTHFFVWVFLATPGLAATLANRGLAIIAGTSTTAYTAFHVEGSETYGAGGRVAKCYPIRYTNTGNASAPFRTLTGSPGANPQYFGATANITGTVKSANLGVDAIRYGTGIYITAGDSGQPANFSGAATENDAIANRWGILTFIGGSLYELQGRFVVGQNNAGTATLAYFSDSNKTIQIVDTPHTLADFTQVIVDHASTEFYWTSVTMEAAGTNNRGRLVFNNASTVAELNTCNFVKVGPTVLRANVTATGCVWRQAGEITLNGGTIIGGSIVESDAAIALKCGSDLSTISGIDFVSAGTGHAMEIDGGTAHTLQDLTFTGYEAPQFNVPSSGDPDYPSVSLLLHMDGANGSTTFTDNSPSPKTLTVTGNAQISTAKNKFGGASGLFDGTGDYLSATNADFSFGTGDFTVEGWVNFTTLKNCGIFHIGATLFPGVTGIGFGLSNTTFRWLLYYNGTQTTASTGPTTNQWYHFAVVRSSGVTRVYVDGTATNLAPNDPANYTGQVLGIGSIFSTNFVLNGHLDDLRITKGVARYTSSFSVPTEAFPNQQASSSSTSAIDVGPNAAIYVNVPSGTVTLTVQGVGDTPSIRTAGAEVIVVVSAATTTLTVTNTAGTPIQDATVLLAASSGAGDLPYQESVTIANSGTTATVTHVGHGLLSNDKILIKGASHAANRGVFTITVTGVDTYTYTMASAPGSNPTGTITSTWVALAGTTDVNGQISASRVFSVNQPVSGWARKSSASPYYKTGLVTGVIDTANGANLSALLIVDE